MGSRIYLGHISKYARERDVERFLKPHGKIREITLKNGYGFAEFDDYRDADDAVYELNGKDLCGERVLVEHARGLPRGGDYRRDRQPPPRSRGGGRGGGGGDRDRGGSGGGRDKYGPPVRTEYRLVVENLSSRVSWQDLKDYMRQAGEVTYADAHKQKKNEGVVEFATYSDMKDALDKLDDTEINGRRIRLVEERPRRSRKSYSRSRSRSRSRGRRSRSKSRSRSRSRSKSRSRSRSPAKRDRSKSRSRSISRSKSKSRSRSPHSKSRSMSRSRSRSPDKRVNKSDREDD